MRRRDKEIFDREIISEILNKSEICRIGMVDNNEAYFVPLNFAHKDGFIYMHSAPWGKKIDLLRKNNRVTFEIEYYSEIIKGDIPCKWTTKYRSIIGKGTIEIIEDIVDKIKGMDVIMEKYGWVFEKNQDGTITRNYEPNHLINMVILKMKIEYINAKQSGDWE